MTAPGGGSGEGSHDDQPKSPASGEGAQQQPAWGAPWESPANDTPPPAYQPPAYPAAGYPAADYPPGYPSDYPPPPPPGYQPPPGYGGAPYPPDEFLCFAAEHAAADHFNASIVMNHVMPPAQPGYGPPPYPGGYPPAPDYLGGYGTARPGTSTMAIVSLISSCLGLLCCIGSIVGIVLGTIALDQIKRDRQEGYGLAVAGIVVGVAGLLIGLIFFIFALHSR